MREPLLPVTKNLIIINVLIYFGTLIWEPSINIGLYQDAKNIADLGRWSLAAFLPMSKYFEPFQIVTNMFMHGSFSHLLFNMLSLFFFGSLVESALGPRRFLLFYLLSGLAALFLFWGMGLLMATVGVNSFVLGASGAIYGVLVAHALIAPDRMVMLLIPPIPIKMKYLVTGMILLDLFGGLSSYSTGTAHFAHIGGGLAGLGLMYFWSLRR